MVKAQGTNRKPLKRRAALLGAGALLGGLLAVPAVTASAGTSGACSDPDDAIYRPPVSATAAPGDVIACRTVDSLPMVGSGTPINAWKVQYGSTDGHGRKDAVAGTVHVATPNALKAHQDIAADLRPNFFKVTGKLCHRAGLQAADWTE